MFIHIICIYIIDYLHTIHYTYHYLHSKMHIYISSVTSWIWNYVLTIKWVTRFRIYRLQFIRFLVSTLLLCLSQNVARYVGRNQCHAPSFLNNFLIVLSCSGALARWMLGVRALFGIGLLVTSRGGSVLTHTGACACVASNIYTKGLVYRQACTMANTIKYLGWVWYDKYCCMSVIICP